jgi:hypothetical protein
VVVQAKGAVLSGVVPRVVDPVRVVRVKAVRVKAKVKTVIKVKKYIKVSPLL